jgi:hypothetical protein
LEDSDSEEEKVVAIIKDDPDSDDDSDDDADDFWTQVMARASPDALAVERKRLEDAIKEKNKLIEDALKEAANHEDGGPHGACRLEDGKRQDVPKEDP